MNESLVCIRFLVRSLLVICVYLTFWGKWEATTNSEFWSWKLKLRWRELNVLTTHHSIKNSNLCSLVRVLVGANCFQKFVNMLKINFTPQPRTLSLLKIDCLLICYWIGTGARSELTICRPKAWHILLPPTPLLLHWNTPLFPPNTWMS